jgi:Flp pilus assembly protein CpaB
MLTAGLVASLLNYTALRALDDTMRVAVTATEVRAGQTLRAEDVTYVDARVDDAVLATLIRPERASDIDGWVVTTTLAPGELLRLSDLQTPSAPAEQRAMSIPIEAEHAVAGELQAGDRVDIIEVVDRSATYLVTAAEVLAVPPMQSAGIAGGLRSFSVTVAVDDATALRLAVALRSGQLEIVRSTGSSTATMDRLDRDAEEAAAGAAAAASSQGEPAVDPTGREG